MSLFAKITSILTASAVTLIALLFGLTATANADCAYQYNANGFTTSDTPVFNNICGAPEGIGDEANFVRIRPDVSGNDEDNVNNPSYTTGSVDSACSTGDKFDVWNYVHNDASQNDNPDVGNGSAVATGAYINMQAPLNTTGSTFQFSATVGDTGNLTKTAGATSTPNMTPAEIDCGNNQVELSIVPASVHAYSVPYAAWENYEPTNGNFDSLFNTNLPIGSTNAGASSFASGTQWGCWTYRVVIVYQVEVTAAPQTIPPVCTTIQNDQADVEKINYTPGTGSADNVTGFRVDLYLGTSSVTGTLVDSVSQSGLTLQSFNFKSSDIMAGKTYTVVGNVLYGTNGDATSTGCTTNFTAPTPPSTPQVVTTSTPPTQTTSASLPNTGPGSVVAIFAAATAIGTGLYYWFIRRRLANK